MLFDEEHFYGFNPADRSSDSGSRDLLEFAALDRIVFVCHGDCGAGSDVLQNLSRCIAVAQRARFGAWHQFRQPLVEQDHRNLWAKTGAKRSGARNYAHVYFLWLSGAVYWHGCDRR